MKMPKKEIQQWIDALRSGKYKQGYKSLQPSPNKYCCLGVACMLFSPKHPMGQDGLLDGISPVKGLGDPLWLAKANGAVFAKLGSSLMELNDGYRLSFEEISDILQLLFIEGALDE